MSEGLGWANAPTGARSYYRRHFNDKDGWLYTNHLGNYQEYCYSCDYSSHDWIADEALGLVLTSPYFSLWEDSQGKPFWDGEGRRRKIFLYATAGPDMNAIRFTSRKGVTVTFIGGMKHHYWFDQYRRPSEPNLGNLALKAAWEAVKAIKDGDCDLGAFCLGAMTHYIADACLYLHTASGFDHGPVESYLSSRMDSCLGVGGYSAYNEYNPLFQYEFFELTISSLFVTASIAPDQCAQIVAYDARYDSIPGIVEGPYTALWMDDRFTFLNEEHILPRAETRGHWVGWAGTAWNDAFLLFSRFEESLDLGVWYTANAMAWVINEVGTYKCSLGVEDLKESITKRLNVGVITSLLSLLGITLIEWMMRASAEALLFEGLIYAL